MDEDCVCVCDNICKKKKNKQEKYNALNHLKLHFYQPPPSQNKARKSESII